MEQGQQSKWEQATPLDYETIEKAQRLVEGKKYQKRRNRLEHAADVETVQEREAREAASAFKRISKASDDVRNAHVTVNEVDTALQFDNPVTFMRAVAPDMKPPYRWQFETLMMMAGYTKPGDYSQKTHSPTDATPQKWAISAANGSGKDQYVIAGFNAWFATSFVQSYAIVTSSSFDQIKGQTEPHIRELCQGVNRRFGNFYKSVQFHHGIQQYGSQIKLFATNTAGKAEGYHPYGRGRMAITANEAKSIEPDIWQGLSRCTGYSYWIEISSPGPKSGHFYQSAQWAKHHPAPFDPDETYFRRVGVDECPHITQRHIRDFIREHGENSPIVQSSLYAHFMDLDGTSIIPQGAWRNCIAANPPLVGDDIGIGLDIAAGGDETVLFVRQGNRIIHQDFFTERDTTIGADRIDYQLAPWKNVPYEFCADNGGIGHGVIDMLERKGWHIRRMNNQSPAAQKIFFLNLGAEIWYHTKRLVERREIIIPIDVDKLETQITSRRLKGSETTQGRIALQSKPEAKAAGLPSPDRADAFTLCFFSYEPDFATYNPQEQKNAEEEMSGAAIVQAFRRGKFQFPEEPENRLNAVYTQLTDKI